MSNFLFENEDTDGDSAVVTAGPRRNGENFNYTVVLTGEFDGATVKLMASGNGTDYVDIPSASWTAATAVNLEMRVPYLKGNISGAGASTSISLYIS